MYQTDPVKVEILNAERTRVVMAAQESVHLDFMTRETLDRLQANDFVASWVSCDPEAVYFFVAVVGDEIVGVADVVKQIDKWLLVEPMHVHPKCQRHGVGRKLWDACLATARRDGAAGLRVVALEQNPVANAFYSKTLRLPAVGMETVTVGPQLFKAVRYELAIG